MTISPFASLVYGNHTVLSSFIWQEEIDAKSSVQHLESLTPSLGSVSLKISQHFFVSFPLIPGLNTLPVPWLFAWHMHDRVSWLDTHSSHCRGSMSFCFCFFVFLPCFQPHAHRPLSVHMCARHVTVVCLSPCLYRVFTCTGLPDPSTSPSPPFLSPCPAPFD